MKKEKKAWVIAVNMGYGHQRTAYPLSRIAVEGKVINANDYKGIAEKDKKIWESSRGFYEFISNFKRVPLLGGLAFSIFNKFQEIPSFYPKRDLSKPTFYLKKIFSMIKDGWGKNLILKLEKKPLPFITTFFIPAFMAELFDYSRDIFCVICDADISRVWTSLNPRGSRIRYFAPNSWVVDRLKMYGVKEENIVLSGYPLPMENIGTGKMEIVKKDLASRILNLDARGKYYQQYRFLIEEHLGKLPKKKDHPLTILFSIGGAGAQKEIALSFVRNLAEKIKNKEIKVILSAGIRKEVKDYFFGNIKKLGLTRNPGVEIIYDKDIKEYFKKFNQKLRKTDILWTKPSELSFYAGLGIPILIAPSIGAQEDFNRRWILRTGAGIVQQNPQYVNQWLFDYLKSGRFAEAAMQGFIEIEKLGVENIKKTINSSVRK